MPVYKLYLSTLLFCAGCALAPNIFELSQKEKANQININPLIPKENIITRTNHKKYTGELVEKITDAELTITQANDFILLGFVLVIILSFGISGLIFIWLAFSFGDNSKMLGADAQPAQKSNVKGYSL